jgi:predicted DNA-binding transcriptional regulator AlpA
MAHEKIEKPINKPLPDFLQNERILSFRQGAELWGVSIATYRRLDRAGKLPPAIQLSERRRGHRAKDLLECLAKRGEAAA